MKFYSSFKLFFILFFCLFATAALAQTISVSNQFFAGPYTPGSSIAVPFHIDDSAGCIAQTNTFNLYLSDAAGNYSATPLATTSNNTFYATYINAIIPATTPAGTGYKVKITATSAPGATIVESAPFSIIAGTAIKPDIDGLDLPSSPGTFGTCTSTANYNFIYNLSAQSTGATSGSVYFFNEQNQSIDATQALPMSGTSNFVANTNNYTIIVRGTDGTAYGTKAYTLINNPANNNLGASGTSSACLSGGRAVLTYTVDINSLRNNYPGDTYRVNWGDGTPVENYTLCQIIAANHTISHAYTKSSCGNTTISGNKGVFEVDIQPYNPYCGIIGTQLVSYAAITVPPSNSFTGPAQTCSNTTITFTNTSYPGQDPSSSSCTNNAAKYTWYVDGVAYQINYILSKALVINGGLTAGTHKIELELQTGTAQCTDIPRAVQYICVQDKPIPRFAIPTATCLSGASTTITPDISATVIDNSCYTGNIYTWKVTTVSGGSNATFAGGTTANSKIPQIQFNGVGVYTVDMSLTDACGNTITAPQKKIIIDGTPTATLSANTSFCGKPQTLNFNNTAGSSTRVIYGGTADATAPTTQYQWTVTAASGGTYSFSNGTSAGSQYPQITLNDYDTYTVSVQQTNSCGTSVIKSQNITLLQAPTVSVTPITATVCAADNTFNGLQGTISDMTHVQSYQWKTSGDGTFSNSTSSLVPVYTLGANDKKGGNILLTLDVKTNLPGQCNDIPQSVTLTVFPTDKVTSAASQSICTNTSLNYQISASNANTSYTWTATGSAGASGFASGSSPAGATAIISDVLINASASTNATVTYTITPTSDGCVGTPFTLTVTVVPNPTLTPVNPVNVCSGKAITGMNLDPSLKYKWTVSAPAGITGATNQTTPVSITNITDILNSTLSTNATVTYAITPENSTGCDGNPITATVTVLPLATLPDVGTSAVTICDQTSYTLQGNTPTTGTGKWTETSGHTVVFADNTNPGTVVNGLVPGTTYQFTWTITGPCDQHSASLTLTDAQSAVGGTATAAVSPLCSGSTAQISLTGNFGSVIGWERSVDNGATWQSITGTNTTLSYANLTQSSLFRAVVSTGACNIARSSPASVAVAPPTPQAQAGADQSLCSGTTTATLQGNNIAGFTGTWIQVPAPTPGVVINSPNNYQTTVSGLQDGKTYTFRWTINGQSPCGNSVADVAINILNPLTNSIDILGSNNKLVCSGASVNINGSTPAGGNGNYTYLWEQSTNNGSSWTTVNGQTGQNAVVTAPQLSLFRRTVFSGSCSLVSNTVTVNTQSAIANNVINGPASTCFNTVPGLISGTGTPTGGDGSLYFYKWQQSTDGTNFTDIAGAAADSYQPQALTVDTWYRRVVSSTLCTGSLANTSTAIKIVVNPDVKASFTATMQTGCAPFNLTPQIITATNDANALSYTWYAGTQQIGTGINFPGYTITNAGQTVIIKLVVSSKLGCHDDTYSLNFSTLQNSAAQFAMSKTSGCGPVAVNFTNQSTPATGINYTWSFGDGSADYHGATPPAHTFIPLTNGKDITYTVTLTPDGCNPTPATHTITVYPAVPVAQIAPQQVAGCSPFILSVDNVSPGTNSGYTFYLYDGGSLVQTVTAPDTRTISFNALSPTVQKKYTVYMVATNLCGTTGESQHINITITPPNLHPLMNVTSASSGCAPFTATFSNVSVGGTSWQYNIYDQNNTPIDHIITGTADQNYTFQTAGTYYVSLSAVNDCSPQGLESAKYKITVFPVPQPAFHALATTGCGPTTVAFSNDTPDDVSNPATSYKYDWDFGDGSAHSSDFAPTHIYQPNASGYTVTLTASTSNNCANVSTRTNYIKIDTPPVAEFTIDPGATLMIPNYHASFTDKSTGKPISWLWNFDDARSGSSNTATSRNAQHTFSDAGDYNVTLTTTTAQGCTDTKTVVVKVTGTPGMLYVPNAFMPSSATDELRRFTVKGTGIKTWRLRIFNNWGQLVFETSKLGLNGEPIEFWDGTFKGQDAKQGVYAWEISATFINGTEWRGMSYRDSAPKKAGTLTLIR